MNHLHFTPVTICFQFNVSTDLLPSSVKRSLVSEMVAVGLLVSVPLNILGILYAKENVRISKSIHDGFHGVLGVVMVSREEEVPFVSCPATCWVLSSFEMFSL